MKKTALALLFALTALGASAQTLTIYHEAWCPSVAQRPMTRMTRMVAVERGLAPAADCHPGETPLVATYLGVLYPGAYSAPEPEKPVEVTGYWRSTPSGGRTWVDEHTRSKPRR